MFTLVKKFHFAGTHVLNGDTQKINKHEFQAKVTFACTELDENEEMFHKDDIYTIINEMIIKFQYAMLLNSDQYIAIHESLQAFVPVGTDLLNMGNVEPTPPNIAKNIFERLTTAIDRLDVINDPFVVYVELKELDEFGPQDVYGYGVHEI